MSDLAERALRAHENAVETKRLRKEDEYNRRRAVALIAITQYAADTFGLTVPDELEPEMEGQRWSMHVTIDDDTSMRFIWEAGRAGDPDELFARVRACDQLYWNLPPGELTKGGGGGSYGCYGLDQAHNVVVTSLTELGAAIAKVRSAREQWNRKHSPETENRS